MYEEAIANEKDRCDKDKERSKDNLSFYYKNQGLAYYHQDRMTEAKTFFDLAIAENRSNPDNYFNLGNVLLNQGDFPAAHMNFDIAIDKDRSNAKFYHAKGLAYQAEAEYINRNEDPSDETEKEELELIHKAIN